jgi:hypothetical protein
MNVRHETNGINEWRLAILWSAMAEIFQNATCHGRMSFDALIRVFEALVWVWGGPDMTG